MDILQKIVFSAPTKLHLFFQLLLIAITTAVVSELKIYPFEHIMFRFGLGSIIFFFALLVSQVPIILTSVITALTVVLFRTGIGVIVLDEDFLSILIQNIPAGLFYIVFALCINRLSLRTLKEYPLQLGLYGAIFEFFANVMEQLLLSLIIGQQFITTRELFILLIVALLRSFFVVGIFSAITISEQKRKVQELLTIHSELYTETLYMQQTMHLVEQLTNDSYQLYKQIQPYNTLLSQEALRISQEIHEIKKNTQRVVAGLSNIIMVDNQPSYALTQLMQFVVDTNRHYSKYLKKSIQFQLNTTTSHHTKNYLALLSIINNITSNAVEAIENDGVIELSVLEHEETIQIIIRNDGPAIPQDFLEALFDAGFTTKFDSLGNASTGIGLHHALTLIQQLQGKIEVTSDTVTTFSITFNKNYL